MDAYTRAALFAAASVLIVSSPFLWAGIDRLHRRRQAERAEAVKRVREWRAQLLELEDRVALETERNAVLRARLMDPSWRPLREAVVDEAEGFVRDLYEQFQDLYDAPTLTRR